jgi:protein MAK16
MIHKCKQRLTKVTQYLMRMRKLALKNRPKLEGIKKKVERREKRRELKAEMAARLEQSIEKELLARLKDGAYGSMYEDIVNVNQKAFDQVMDSLEVEDEQEEEEYEQEMEQEGDLLTEYVEADSDEEFSDGELYDEDMEDGIEDLEGDDYDSEYDDDDGEDEFGDDDTEIHSGDDDNDSEVGDDGPRKPIKSAPASQKPAKTKRKRGAYLEIEYEQENSGHISTTATSR